MVFPSRLVTETEVCVDQWDYELTEMEAPSCSYTQGDSFLAC